MHNETATEKKKKLLKFLVDIIMEELLQNIKRNKITELAYVEHPRFYLAVKKQTNDQTQRQFCSRASFIKYILNKLK